MEEFSVVIMKRFRSNWFKKTKGRHVTYNTRQSVLRRKRIYASCESARIPFIVTSMVPYDWTKSSFLIRIVPNIDIYGGAIDDMLIYLKWKKVGFLYDNPQG
jgi:hypothetical protein